ncbi:MAG: hypothetical protein JO047_09635 [Alphaproteobacteria bacterium]|nr:hypothetical protein [Alphaproteobacteria bacterium]
MSSERSLAAFRASLSAGEPPEQAPALRALWWDGKGDWDRAHEAAQEGGDQDCAWVHAYLHRKEGDFANAGYWYSRAGKPVPAGSLDEEWSNLVGTLLGRATG